MKIKYLIIFFLTFFYIQSSNAGCNFNTSDYIDELSNPKSISSIDIKIANSNKYYKNAFRIIASRLPNISTELKKRFSASILVNYNFGTCEFDARVRQNGDWKQDHINFVAGGKVIRSLDIKLDEGNILNAVRFKLLLPESRNGINEILASLILSKVGFISPETFEVQTSVNGIYSKMLFQENAEKELLERLSRREGPIFEGDESLLWSYEHYEHFELERLALSRLENINWFKKGLNSQKIILDSHARLQESYLEYAANIKNKKSSKLAIFPNKLKDQTFINYHFVIKAMNGSHALRPHNRKYYFNAIENKFEPIYYDGMVNFDKPIEIKKQDDRLYSWQTEFMSLFPRSPSKKFLEKLSSSSLYSQLLEDFIQRVNMPRDSAKEFLSKSLNQFRINQKILQKEIQNIEIKNHSNNALNNHFYLYKNLLNTKSLDQIIINKINFDYENYLLYSSLGDQFTLTNNELADLLSKNIIAGKRAVYLAPSNSIKIDRGNMLSIKNLNGTITVSKGISVDLNVDEKIVKFIQSNSNDWVLISEVDFSDWKIFFQGVKTKNNHDNKSIQRFNNVGLTGCLNIYKAKIHRTSLTVENGGCEDSVNVISSEGNAVSISISNAFADAVDFDFSKLAIKKLKIKSAGNDCIDVSMGKYSITEANIEKCGDKAISVGERSVLEVNKVYINNAMTALAVKDLSILKVLEFEASNISFCGQVYQKKQEFGGAILEILKSNCSAPIKFDKVSRYVKKN